MNFYFYKVKNAAYKKKQKNIFKKVAYTSKYTVLISKIFYLFEN